MRTLLTLYDDSGKPVLEMRGFPNAEWVGHPYPMLVDGRLVSRVSVSVDAVPQPAEEAVTGLDPRD